MNEFKTLSDKRKKTSGDIKYLFSKINWSNSFLDAQAIKIMNEFWKDVIDADKEFIRLIKAEVKNRQKMRSDKQIEEELKRLEKYKGSTSPRIHNQIRTLKWVLNKEKTTTKTEVKEVKK